MAMMGTGSASGENRAHEAATKAVHSPLLDDIDLNGAKGILVNITAGLDLSIGEFDEVGNTVRDFADDDATVVVGTVIDPEMQGELRVTVVATGLGKTALEPMLTVVEPREEAPIVTKAVGDDLTISAPDYSQYDIPTAKRNAGRDAKRYVEAAVENDMDFLDIPAFLRRQAD
jgi:cell division protein FtsZ